MSILNGWAGTSASISYPLALALSFSLPAPSQKGRHPPSRPGSLSSVLRGRA